ncbi:hypothetical protein [Pseudomonas sp. GD03944]|uniref:hypothetical protein n=1 Tax=Pseudomonas sp. GD03944 TaxID=2975409 RepID=UPI00244A0E65|nr:hypothetical protein [Pseudomonas sp. GD03944]MDH1263377.1 hypothetical protein [Pseudomonas sp. GD03944]
MNKLMAIAIFMLAVASNPAFADSSCLLEGRWQSNREMTLASMSESGTVPEKYKELFNGDFFGKITIETTCDSFTTYWEDTIDVKAYETLSQAGNTITVRYVVPEEDIPFTATLTVLDDCYSIPLERFNFSEYFCKSDQ